MILLLQSDDLISPLKVGFKFVNVFSCAVSVHLAFLVFFLVHLTCAFSVLLASRSIVGSKE